MLHHNENKYWYKNTSCTSIGFCACFDYNVSLQEASRGSDLGAIFEKIRIAVYKNGVRTTEFFRDHDKLRSGIITENQVCMYGSKEFPYDFGNKISFEDQSITLITVAEAVKRRLDSAIHWLYKLFELL